MYEHQVTLADAAADTRTASRSQHKPTHALGHSLYIGIQLCRPRAAKSVRACVTVRPVRVSAAGGAGAAGAAHTTNSVRHMLLAVFETGLQPSLLKVVLVHVQEVQMYQSFFLLYNDNFFGHAPPSAILNS